MFDGKVIIDRDKSSLPSDRLQRLCSLSTSHSARVMHERWGREGLYRRAIGS
jgi:hypothetical protein